MPLQECITVTYIYIYIYMCVCVCVCVFGPDRVVGIATA